MGIKKRIKERIKNSLSDLDLITLSLIGSNDSESIKDNTHFQKEMFLISINRDNLWSRVNFIPHAFGQYSESAEESLKTLRSYGLIDKKAIRLNENGKELYKTVISKLSDEDRKMIQDFKDLLNDLTNDEMLVLMYYSYPEFSVESTVKKDIERVRIPCAISLYQKGKVSLQKAAYLAGLNLEKFMNLIKK